MAASVAVAWVTASLAWVGSDAGAMPPVSGMPPVSPVPDSALPFDESAEPASARTGGNGSSGTNRAESAVASADVALGERLALLADAVLSSDLVDDATILRQAVATADAAHRLSPQSVEHLRTLADARLAAGDRSGAIDALSRLRRLAPDNEVAAIQFVDLHVLGLETADRQVEYLRGVSETTGIGPAVRSHAAAEAARVLDGRGQERQADTMTDRAIELNPVNAVALQRRYERLARDVSPERRLAALLDLLRVDPAQPGVLAAVASLLADVGLAERAVDWYELSSRTAERLGITADSRDRIDRAAQLLAANQPREAVEALAGVLQQDPERIEGRFVQLSALSRSNDAGALQRSAEELRGLLRARLNAVAKEVGDAVSDASPAAGGDGSMPDVVADANRIVAVHRGDLAAAYAASLADLAWLEIAYAGRAPEPAILEALRTLLGDESVTVARLSGWSFLVRDRPDEARVKLEGVADTDPLAAAGLLRLRSAGGERGADLTAEAQRLVDAHRSGLLGVMLLDAMSPINPRVRATDAATAVLATLDAFPRPLLDVLDRPELVREFYTVKVDRESVAHGYADPMRVRVTIRNTSGRPMAIGPLGLLKPTLHVDATTTGVTPGQFPAVARQAMTRRVLLPAGESIVETVRIDRGRLRQHLSGLPQVPVPVFASVLTNPVTVRREVPEGGEQVGTIAGLLGVRTSGQVMERSARPLSAESSQDVMRQLQRGAGVPALSAGELLAAYVSLIGQSADVEGATRDAASRFVDALRVASQTQTTPAVRAYSGFLYVGLVPEAERVPRVRALLTSDDWRARFLGTVAAAGLDGSTRRDLLTPVAESDPDDTVRAYAAATLEDERGPAESPAASGE